LQALARRITGVPDNSPIVAVGRRAIAESPLKIGGKPHHAWLFSDRVVYGKPAQKGTFKYKGEFDLRDQTLIRNFIDTKSVSNAFELVRVADRTTVVCAMPDSTTKQTWMVAISNAIREHMRAAATRLRTLLDGRLARRRRPLPRRRSPRWRVERRRTLSSLDARQPGAAGRAAR
jgi:hypothetical protein